MSRAVFLDRDGTVTEEVGYLTDLDKLSVIPGAGAAIRKLNAAGFKVILYFTDEEFEKVHRILKDLGMEADRNIYLIDGRLENKPSGSRA